MNDLGKLFFVQTCFREKDLQNIVCLMKKAPGGKFGFLIHWPQSAAKQ